MRLFLKIVLIIYYFILGIYLFFLTLSINAIDGVTGQSIFEYKFLEIFNNIIYVALFLSGVLNISNRHKSFLSKYYLLVFISLLTVSLTVSYVLLHVVKDNHNYSMHIVALPFLPCLVHNIWYYFNYDKATYNLDSFNGEPPTEYSQIFDLNLPFLKINEYNKEILDVSISVPYGIGKVFGVIFIIIWLSGWTFGGTAMVLGYPWTVFIFLPIFIFVFYFFLIDIFFIKIRMILTPTSVRITKLPIKKTIQFNDADDVRVKESCGSRGGCNFYFFDIKNHKNIRIRNREMYYVIILIVLVYQHKREAGESGI